MMQARTASAWRAAVIATLGVVSLSGCSTQVRVSQLASDAKPGTRVDGIPFRTAQRYTLSLYRLVDGQYVKIEADKGVATLPDPDRLYVLRLNGMPFSDDTVAVTLGPDGTLTKVDVDAKGKVKEAADGLAKSVGDVDTARTARKTAAEAEKTTGETARLDAQKARLDAELAEVEVAALPADATAAARKTAENKLSNLRLEANQKARKAGLALPFPDVGT